MKKDVDLPTEFIQEKLDELPSKPETITLTGGEPLLRNDLKELVEQLGYPAVIVTNGSLLVEKADYLHSISVPLMVIVSMDWVGRRHDSNRRFRGLTQLIKEGLMKLKRGGIVETRLLDTLMRDVCEEGSIRALMSFARDYCVGEKVISFQRYFPIKNGPPPPRLDQLHTAFGLIERIGEELGVGYRILDPCYWRSRRGCFGRYFVTVKGSWKNCPFHPMEFDSVERLNAVREKQNAHIPPECTRCDRVEDCRGGCVAYRLRYNEDGLKQRDPYCLISG